MDQQRNEATQRSNVMEQRRNNPTQRNDDVTKLMLDGDTMEHRNAQEQLLWDDATDGQRGHNGTTQQQQRKGRNMQGDDNDATI